MSNVNEPKYEWIWEKSHPTGFASSKYNPLKYHESVIIFFKKTTIYNPQMTTGKPNHSMGKILNGGIIKSDSQLHIKAIQSQQSENKYPKSIQKFSNPRFKNMHPTKTSSFIRIPHQDFIQTKMKPYLITLWGQVVPALLV